MADCKVIWNHPPPSPQPGERLGICLASRSSSKPRLPATRPATCRTSSTGSRPVRRWRCTWRVDRKVLDAAVRSVTSAAAWARWHVNERRPAGSSFDSGRDGNSPGACLPCIQVDLCGTAPMWRSTWGTLPGHDSRRRPGQPGHHAEGAESEDIVVLLSFFSPLHSRAALHLGDGELADAQDLLD